MEKRRITIEVHKGISDQEAISRVLKVVEKGKVSGNNDTYCYVTCWQDGVVVLSRSKSKRIKSDRFAVWFDETYDERNEGQ